jgi:hypothetical protein
LAKREVALAKWKPPTADTPANPAAVLLGANGQRLTNRVQRLIEARDNRPMRLRE